MSEPSRMQVKVTLGEEHGPRPRVTPQLTLERVINWIDRQPLDDYTKKGLAKLAATYPNAALPSFRRNFNLMIQRVRAKRRQEQGDMEDVREENTSQQPIGPVASLDEAFNSIPVEKPVEKPAIAASRRKPIDLSEEQPVEEVVGETESQEVAEVPTSLDDWANEANQL